MQKNEWLKSGHLATISCTYCAWPALAQDSYFTFLQTEWKEYDFAAAVNWTPGANPTITIYNSSVVNFYDTRPDILNWILQFFVL